MKKWLLLIALMVGILYGFLVKSGIAVHTQEESALRPGQEVEIYQEQVISEGIKMKQQIQELEKQREKEVFW